MNTLNLKGGAFPTNEGKIVVGLEPAWKMRHTRYIDALLECPPTGYDFRPLLDLQQPLWQVLSRSGLSFDIQRITSEFIPLPLLKALFGRSTSSRGGVGLTYALDHIALGKKPWVLEVTFELPSNLVGSETQLMIFKGLVRRVLGNDTCLGISFQLRIAMKAFVTTFGEFIEQKSMVIPQSGVPHYFEKHDSRDVVLLFVNSQNIINTNNFFMKGGREVIQAFGMLRAKYQNTKLIIRSQVPSDYRSTIKKIRGVQLLENNLTPSEMDRLWKSCDIFLHPHHGTPASTLVDAMGYGLPIVTTDTWGTGEVINDGVDGYLVHDPIAEYYQEGPILHLGRKYTDAIRREHQPELVQQLVEKTSVLIEDSRLRRSMGNRGREKVASGALSIASRNASLKAFLDQALQNL